jgi:rod shape-determining protein MreC
VSTLSTRQTIGLVVLFAVTAVTFVLLDRRDALDPLKNSVHQLTVPVTDFFNRANREDQSQLAQELEQVTAERDALKAENVQLKAQAKEVEDLQNVLNVQRDHTEWDLVTARVLSPDPAGLSKFITIDKGSADGIRKGMAVVDPYYFVGLVTDVEPHTAKITLAIDGSAAIGAQLTDSQADGVVYGVWQLGRRLEMRYVDRSVTPKQGEIVVTSNNVESRTAGVPGNLIIGKVETVPDKDNQGDSQTIEILPACDFDNLKIVAVIVNDGQDGS